MSTVEPTPATGEHTTDGTPHGHSTLTPFLALEDPNEALVFYTRVFGARVISCTRMGDQIVHAEVELANGRLQLGAAQDAYHLRAIDPKDPSTQFSLGIYVPNVDDVVTAAIEAGAVLREPVETFVSGDRYGSIRDPFGVRWSVMTRVEDLSDEQSRERVEQWAASLAQ